MKVPGSDLNNIFTIRVPEDAKAIFSQLTPKSNVVVVGSSFIGNVIHAFFTCILNVITHELINCLKYLLGENQAPNFIF